MYCITHVTGSVKLNQDFLGQGVWDQTCILDILCFFCFLFGDSFIHLSCALESFTWN